MRIAIPNELVDYIKIKDDKITETKKIPNELKEKFEEFKKDFAFALYKTKGIVTEEIKDKIVDDIIRQIQELPLDKKFTIKELASEFIDNKELLDISFAVLEGLKETYIDIQSVCGENAIVGLPYNIPYIKKIDFDCLMGKSAETYNINDKKELDIEAQYEEYSKIFKEKFNREPYIAEPNGTKEQTINAIKICIEKNEDILDQLLY